SDFLDLRASSKAVLFPLLDSPAGKINGIVLMERDSKAGNFSENLLDLGSIISQMLGPKLLRLASESGADDSLTIVEEAFDRTVLPVVIINRKTLTIERVNDAASAFLSAGNKLAGASVIGSGLGALFPGASHFIEVLEKACAKNTGPSCFSVSAKDLTHTGCAFALVSFVGEGGKHVWVQLIPENFLPESKGKSTTDGAGKRGGSRPSVDDGEDDAVLELSRRLNFERWLRQTICKLHSSLDRDHVLQTLADSLGRAFRATRCLVIRTDGPSHPMVTHEYVEPDLSPLGLGRTGQFPMFAISLFVQKTVSFGDVSQMKSTGPLIPPEVDQLLENGILSMAGAPLSYQGQPFGVLILVDGSRPRRWTEEELETIELTASQASVALSHSQTYHQAKDQLFHMNLLGNLTQQLTNALEVATKSPSKSSSPTPERTQSEGSQTPLSSREMEVLRLIASGFANREIAQRLFLTESTVELHASRIRKKLQLKSRTALVKYACDNSLV
ncbi:MAG: GAF domain-containing protein, partial [Cyanobacteria bacterium SZAS LIN-2]|nr:GAF domain-containing protein [Cyanobacteria bacterium SZAS LIN-2]